MILRPQHIIRQTDAFNATTSNINFGAQDATQNPSAQSALAYCLPLGSGENSVNCLFAKVPSSTTDGVQFNLHHNAGNPTYYFQATSTSVTGQPVNGSNAGAVQYNKWQHFAFSWDGSLLGAGIKLYQGIENASLKEPSSYAGTADGATAIKTGTGNNLRLGNREGTDNTFNGTIAYVARWNRVLTLTEFLTAQRFGPLAVPRGLILCWANGRDYGPYGIMPTSKTALQGGMMPSRRWLGYSRTTWMIQAQAAGGVEIAPGFGNLILTGYEPTVSATDGTRAISTGLGELTITGHAPTVSYTENKVASPALGELVITGYAPTVGQGYTVTPGLGELVLTGYAPTVSRTEHVIVNPETGALIITGYEPTALVEGSWTVSTDLGNLILTGYAPSVVNSGDTVAPTGQTPAGTSKRRQDQRRRRIMLPDGTLIWATFDEAYDLMQAHTKPVEERPEGRRAAAKAKSAEKASIGQEDIRWVPVHDTISETYKPVLPLEWEFIPDGRGYWNAIRALQRRQDDEDAITMLLLH